MNSQKGHPPSRGTEPRYRYLADIDSNHTPQQDLQRLYCQEYERNTADPYQLSEGKHSRHDTEPQSQWEQELEYLRYENGQLRADLGESLKLVDSLRQLMSKAEREIGALRSETVEIAQRHRTNEGLLVEELKTLIAKNQHLNEDIAEVQQLVLAQSSMHQSRSLLHSQEGRCGKEELPSQQARDPSERTLKHFIRSVRDMHLKIVGREASSLTEVWRWLKEMGQSCSYFRKWRGKVRKHLQDHKLTIDSALALLEEAAY